MMPRKGFLTRAHQLAALTEVIHDRKIDPRIPDWLDDILSKKRLSRLEDANLKEISRIFSQTSKVPKKLSTELSKKIALPLIPFNSKISSSLNFLLKFSKFTLFLSPVFLNLLFVR